jgi:hypothetical protein
MAAKRQPFAGAYMNMHTTKIQYLPLVRKKEIVGTFPSYTERRAAICRTQSRWNGYAYSCLLMFAPMLTQLFRKPMVYSETLS